MAKQVKQVTEVKQEQASNPQDDLKVQAFKNVFQACKMAQGNADFHVMVANSLQIVGKELKIYE